MTERTSYDERFYVEATWYVREAINAGRTPQSAFDGMVARASLLDAALKDADFRQEAVAVLQGKMSTLTPSLAEATIDHLFAERLQAQQDYAQRAADPAFREEVLQRAAAVDGMSPKTPLVCETPPCRLILPQEPVSWLARYTGARGLLGDAGAATLRMGEEALQKALIETFGGSDHLLQGPLEAAFTRANITVDQPFADIADSFLSSRTTEAMDRAALLAADGWVMQQLTRLQAATAIQTGHGVVHQGAVDDHARQI